MCEFSIHVDSRDAVVGDKLVTTDFGAGTRGFSAVGNRKIAVCLKPGTELVFDKEVRVKRPFEDSFIAFLKDMFSLDYDVVGGATAVFRQVGDFGHRDSLEFPNGNTVLLTKLTPGQKATVLQLPAEKAKVYPSTTNAPKEIHVGGGCSIVTAPELETIS